jgi:hypothetical protein
MPPPNPPPPPRGTPLPTSQQPANVALAQIADQLAKLADKSREAAPEVEKTASAFDKLKKGLGETTAQLVVLGRLVKAPFDAIDQFVGNVNANVARYVAAFNPAVVVRWELAVKDLMATIGAQLLPLLEKLTGVIHIVGSVISSLDGPARTLVVGLAGAAAGLAVATVAAVAFSAAMNSAFAGIPALLGAVTGAAAGIFLAVKDAPGMADTLEKLGASVAAVGNALGEVLTPVMEAFAPVIDELLKVFAEDLAVVANAMKDLRPVMEVVARAVAGLVRDFAFLLSPLHQLAELLKMLGYTADVPKLRPPERAVRDVQMGSVADLFTRAMKTTFAGGGKAMTTESLLVVNNNYLKDIEKWTREAKEFLDKIRQAVEAGAGGVIGQAPEAAKGAATGVFGLGGTGEWLMQRQFMQSVGGK